MIPLKLFLLVNIFQNIDRFLVSGHIGNGSKTFQMQWQNGSVELFSYENSESNDCIYDEIRDILTCTKNHPYDVITSRWRKNPDSIKYVSVNCLLQDHSSNKSQACLCKNSTMAVQSTRDVDKEKYYSCQLETLRFNIFSALINTEIINLSYNKIRSIDAESFQNCEALEYLVLNHNPLKSYPTGMLCGLSRLRFVDISNQLMTRFPSNMFKCDTAYQSGIIVLNTSRCLIEEIVDGSFTHLQNLTSLDMNGNRIKMITDNGFLGASSLTYINLSNNSLSQIPLSLCQHTTKLKYLFLNKNRLQIVNMTNFQNCESLETVDLSENMLRDLEGPLSPMTSLKTLKLAHNNLSVIRDTMMLKHFTAISELDFSWNKILSIEDASFDEINNIKSLDLSHNNIGEDSVNFRRVFRNIGSLRYLNLSSNGLVTVEEFSFEGLSSLEVLDLSYNKLKTITVSSFRGLESLRQLKISLNKVQTIDINSFLNLSNLESVDISHNELVTLEDVYMPKIQVLDSSWNRLESIPRHLPGTITRLLLNKNRISSLGQEDLQRLTMLQDLNLSHNAIQSLDGYPFVSSINITTIDLSFNELQLDFNKDVFRGMQHIRNIFLTHNNINSIDGILKFDTLASLQNLDLSANKIKHIKESLNPGNQSRLLQTLNLEGCLIETIVKIAFINLPFLKLVNLQRNRIRNVPLFDASPAAVILLKNNRLLCSCDMSWLIKTFSNISSLDYRADVCTVHPQGWKHPIRTLSLDQFLCPVTMSCSEKCSCYSMKGNGTVSTSVCQGGLLTIPTDISNVSTTIYLDGNNFASLGTIAALFITEMSVTKLFMNNSHVLGIGSTFFHNTIHLEEVDLSYNYIEILPSDIFHRLTNLKVVCLQQNEISHLPSSLFKDLIFLETFDISNNQLTNLLPETMRELDNMEQFDWIKLSSNPWRCECSNKPMRNWLEKSSSPVYDRQRLLCNNEKILSASLDTFYCPPALSNAAKIGLICILVAMFILGIAITIAYYRKTLIPIVYTRLGLKCLKRNQLSKSASTLYDLIVLVDDKDHKCVWWVKNSLIPKLTRKRWKFRIHVPEPNNESGEITNSTMFKINQSSATLIVVSKHFQDNLWCVECSQHAYNLMLCKQHVVVLLAWGNINVYNLDSEMRKQIEEGDNLGVREKFLWDKLIYKLPYPGNPEKMSSVCEIKIGVKGTENEGFADENATRDLKRKV